MNILFITFSDITVCSSSNIRNVSLIKGLLDLGHTVDIISYKIANKSALIDESFAPIISKCRIIEITASLSTEKFSSSLLSSNNNTIKRKLYNKLRKVYYSLETVDSMRKIANEIDISYLDLREYDLMISSSNPYSVHILAERIRDHYYDGKIRWIQYWGDALYLDTLTRRPILPFRVKEAEKRLISKCDKVVYTNGVVLELQKELFPEYKNKMSFIETPFAFKTENTGPFRYEVGYFGSYSSSVRDINPLYSVLRNSSLQSVIIGNGDQIIESSNNLTVLPRASVNEVIKYEQDTRLLVCICNKLSKKGETGLIPGKIYHYASTNKPVLVIGATSKVRIFLERYGRFEFADNNEQEIATKLVDILSKFCLVSNPLEETKPSNAAIKILE